MHQRTVNQRVCCLWRAYGSAGHRATSESDSEWTESKICRCRSNSTPSSARMRSRLFSIFGPESSALLCLSSQIVIAETKNLEPLVIIYIKREIIRCMPTHGTTVWTRLAQRTRTRNNSPPQPPKSITVVACSSSQEKEFDLRSALQH